MLLIFSQMRDTITFRSDGQHGRIDWDPNTNGFLNAKKMTVDHNLKMESH